MGFNFGKQSSKQESSQGLMPGERSYFSGLTPGYFRQFDTRAKQAMGDPGGLEYMNVVDRLLPTGRYGLPVGATEGVHQLGRDLFAQTSGARAARGFRSPDNLEAALGDAIRMASGQLIPLSTQFAMQRAQMAPALRSAAFGYGSAPLETLRNLLASSGASKGTSSGFGFGFTLPGGKDAASLPAALGF